MVGVVKNQEIIMSNHTPIDLTERQTTQVTLRSSATTVFRWIRTGMDRARTSPALAKYVGTELVKAWRDSAKR